MSRPTYMDLPPWDMGAVLRPRRFLPPIFASWHFCKSPLIKEDGPEMSHKKKKQLGHRKRVRANNPGMSWGSKKLHVEGMIFGFISILMVLTLWAGGTPARGAAPEGVAAAPEAGPPSGGRGAAEADDVAQEDEGGGGGRGGGYPGPGCCPEMMAVAPEAGPAVGGTGPAVYVDGVEEDDEEE